MTTMTTRSMPASAQPRSVHLAAETLAMPPLPFTVSASLSLSVSFGTTTRTRGVMLACTRTQIVHTCTREDGVHAHPPRAALRACSRRNRDESLSRLRCAAERVECCSCRVFVVLLLLLAFSEVRSVLLRVEDDGTPECWPRDEI